MEAVTAWLQDPLKVWHLLIVFAVFAWILHGTEKRTIAIAEMM